MMFKRLIIVIFPMLLYACFDEGNCLVNFTDTVNIDFKNEDKSERKITFDSIQVDGITLQNYSAKELSTVQLPVNLHATESTFLFFYQPETDTIVVSYDRDAVVLTSDCGANNYYTGLAIESTDFEDARLLNSKLLKDVKTHVEIYF